MARQVYNLKERFADAACAAQREEGWKKARADFRAVLDRIQEWRASPRFTATRTEGGDPLDRDPGEAKKSYMRSCEVMLLIDTMDNLAAAAGRKEIGLVSDRFYKGMYESFYNRMEIGKFTDEDAGYRAFWHELKLALDDKIDHVSKQIQDIDDRSDSCLFQHAALLRVKELCRQVLAGKTPDEAFGKAYGQEAPRFWHPVSPATGTLPETGQQLAELAVNRDDQLADNLLALHLCVETDRPDGPRYFVFTPETGAVRRQIMLSWLGAIVHEYDSFRSCEALDPRKGKWMDDLLSSLAQRLETTLDKVRLEPPRLILPLRPLWRGGAALARGDDPLHAFHPAAVEESRNRGPAPGSP